MKLFDVNNDVPEDGEIHHAMKRLRYRCTGRAHSIHTDDLRGWLQNAEDEEDNKKKGVMVPTGGLL